MCSYRAVFLVYSCFYKTVALTSLARSMYYRCDVDKFSKIQLHHPMERPSEKAWHIEVVFHEGRSMKYKTITRH